MVGLRSLRVWVRAYSADLRRENVEAVRQGVPEAQAARTCGIGVVISSVERYVKVTREGESLVPK